MSIRYKGIISLLIVFCQILLGQHLLHLTFHKGCVREIEYIARVCGIKLTTLFIPDLPPFFFDPLSTGNVLYNVNENRAERIWNRHHHFFEQFDGIIVSDTAPLARIFLQHEWKKPIIIWICNRFDYADCATLDGEFPDPVYYDLIKNALKMNNVYVIAYMNFEKYYMEGKGISITEDTLKPCAPITQSMVESFIPPSVSKSEMFFIPPYHNDTIFIDMVKKCQELCIPCYCGRYNGAQDLRGFKGIIHIPYSWSTLAFFENMQLGIPYFVPSFSFLKQLVGAKKSDFFHPQAHVLIDHERLDLSDWYSADYQSVITYFDSWQDLQEKVINTDFDLLSKTVKLFASEHHQKMIAKWKYIFRSFNLINGES